MKKMKMWLTMLLAVVLLAGCMERIPMPTWTDPSDSPTTQRTEPTGDSSTEGSVPEQSETSPTQTPTTQPTTQPTQPVIQPTETEPTEAEKLLVVIDAGHQSKANYDKEPVGPGSTELKTKVSSGTQGVSTKLEEYKLNLLVAVKLQRILEARGYEVVMIRTSHDVNISNAERAAVANDLGADAFIRIHANGSENPQTNGLVTICQTKDNPYNAWLYEESKNLSSLVLKEMATATGATPLYVWETDTMSGINWCQVPVTIVEMGFMSCPWEDELMATDAYQDKLALGIANGIDAYFGA